MNHKGLRGRARLASEIERALEAQILGMAVAATAIVCHDEFFEPPKEKK